MIVSELCLCSLADIFDNAALGKGPHLPPARACELMCDCAKAMAYLHGKKPTPMIHRDLKPANLMIRGPQYRSSDPQAMTDLVLKYGILKVGDFGLSRSLPAIRARHERILPDPTKGTIQLAGTKSGKVDASDAIQKAAVETGMTTTMGNAVTDEEGTKTSAVSSGGDSSNRRTPRNDSFESADHHHVGFTVSTRDGGSPGDKQFSRMKSMASRKYDFTGETGSYRYMAPEVFRHEPYSYKVDAYAFAMIAYEAFDGIRPFMNLAAVEAAEAASIRNLRPNFQQLANGNYASPAPIRALIEACWSGNSRERPEFEEIAKRIDATRKVLAEDRRVGTCASKCVIS